MIDEIFITYVVVLLGLFQLFLMFKFWGLCDDIKDIKNILENNSND